jgi:hypothetical protein
MTHSEFVTRFQAKALLAKQFGDWQMGNSPPMACPHPLSPRQDEHCKRHRGMIYLLTNGLCKFTFSLIDQPAFLQLCLKTH